MTTASNAPIVLSSSPVPQLPPQYDNEVVRRRATTTPPSSPLPSPSDFLRRAALLASNPQPDTTGGGAPVTSPHIEDGVSRHFSAAQPAKQQQTADNVQQGTKRKRAPKVVAGPSGAPKARKRPAKAKATGDEACAETAGDTVEGKTARRRAKAAKVVIEPNDSRFGDDSAEVSRHFGAKVVETETNPDLGLPAAMARRRSWTPTSAANVVDQDKMDGAIDAAEPEPGGFGAVVAGFGFVDAGNSRSGAGISGAIETRKADNGLECAETRDGMGKPATKKARAPRKEKQPRPPKAPKAPKEKKAARPAKTPKEPKVPKVPKVAKAPKVPKVVRPKTITDIAIAAYRKAPQDTTTAETQVTTYFKPTGTQIVQLVHDPARTLEPENVKVVPSRPQAAMIQFQFPPPDKAKLHMRNQDFMFGTSSQLAKDDSPRTHRMMQQALNESEDLAFASQAKSSDVERSPTTSKARVATAPHGTILLSGDRNLWAVAARDEDDRMFVCSQKSRGEDRDHSLRILASSPPASPAVQCDSNLTRAVSNPLLGANAVLPRDEAVEWHDIDSASIESASKQSKANVAGKSDSEMHDSGFVDISDLDRSQELPKPVTEAAARRPSGQVEPTLPSSPLSLPLGRRALQDIDVNTPGSKRPPDRGLALKATSIMLSPRKKTNAPDKVEASQAEPQVKRPRGRPRKDATISAPLASAPVKTKPAKPKGSSSKTVEQHPEHVSAFSTPAKKRGRPPKSKTQIVVEKNWIDIDEISDSEASIATPSPPRRPVASIPASPQTLELSSDSAPLRGKSQGQVKAGLPEDSMGATLAEKAMAEHEERARNTAANQEALFASITKLVKSQPRTNDLAKPTWWEKILLYDPIVLEDLTDWLISQGVRPDGTIADESARIGNLGNEREQDAMEAAKPKGKGKGKAKAKEKAKPERKERNWELQPFVVQRWCETNSICCLWKAGLRGGVRQRY